MKKIISWIMANMLTVASIVLTIIAICGLWFIQSSSAALQEKANKRVKVIDNIKRLGEQSVPFPSDNPQQPMVDLTITVNKRAVERMRDIRSRMNAERDDVVDAAMEINKGNHRVMIDGLFPKERNTSMPFEAQKIYRKAFKQMLEPFSPDSRYPALNAGPTPDTDEIQDALFKVEQEFLAGFKVNSIQALDVKQQETLLKKKRKLLLDALQRQARKINIYAETDMNIENDYPFTLGDWSTSENTPLLSEIWYGQMELWVQQDIVQAIAQTNQVQAASGNVMTAPIKRLVKIEVMPQYVGLQDNDGGIRIGGDSGFTNDGPGMMGDNFDIFGGGMIPMDVIRGGGAAEKKKTKKKKRKSVDDDDDDFDVWDDEEEQSSSDTEIEVKVEDRFYYGPTGRASNGLYDVWHAQLTIIVDYRRLPEFFDQLKNVNFMTVLKIDITDIDEYEQLQKGYVYGSDDAVQVDLLIESLWLRDWTQRLMPEKVKEDLEIGVAE